MMRRIVIILLMFAFAGCEKQTEWALQNADSDLVVVDAILTDDHGIQTIRLSRTVTELNRQPTPVSGAGVLISDGNSTTSFTEMPAASGIYQASNVPGMTAGKTFSLLVTTGSNVYTAKARMMPGIAFSPLRYSKNKNNNLYHIDWIANSYNAEKAAMYEILIDWSHLPAYSGTDSTLCTAKLYYYTLTTLDVSEIFAPETERISFPAGSMITERRYSLSPDFESYLRAMLSETSWRGGLFDSAPAGIPTNLSAGATGFFAACGVTEISMIVTP